MKLYIYATLFISLNSIAQSDIKIDSVFNRSNLNNYFTHGLDYYKMPNSYTQLIEFSAIVINDGAVMETNCYLKVDVLYNNSVIYSDSSNSVTINSMGSDSLVVLTPLDMSTESIGDYTFIYSVYSDGLDINTTNNTDTLSFELTDYTIARHNSEQTTQTTDLYTSTNDYWGIGYLFEIPENACLSYASIWVTDEAINDGRLLQAELWEVDTITNVFNRLTWSEPLTVGFEGVRNPTKLLFPFQNALSSGKIYFIGVYYSTNAEVGIQMTQTSIKNTVFEMNGNAIPGGVVFSIDTLLNTYIPRIDIEFDNSIQCSLILDKVKNIQERVFPNPITNELNLSFETITNGVLTIFNVNGKIVYSEKFKNSNSLTINSSEFAKGVYFYKLVDGDSGLSIEKGKIIKN